MCADYKHRNARHLAGVIGPVDYTGFTGYRPPPWLYRRLQPIAAALTSLGSSPEYAVVLEVPGRHSGIIRRTNLVRIEYDGRHYLVSLAGESEWVRNTRAAAGHVVVGRRERRGATLAEVPAAEWPEVIRACLTRAGRKARSWSKTSEARHYFGVSTEPSAEDLARISRQYPVFRIDYQAVTPARGVQP
ncbi:nitroreductase/quinone reductase family protein [Nocardia sp. CA-151230]|uniref:nitroreductase/quinone reductase family protein n=1 Tax=Nocardia sp. CA-151230 TaxID=3239982 RepID=UPI003D929A7E